MERIKDTGRTGMGVCCPLCGHPDAHYLKEKDIWVCNHCQYTWYTIEHCTNRRHPGN
ncbi:MAG: hypothetical protein M0Q91_06350 [Methanoregula sp.]|nr:hypothetical protein [Methanoregula sp.]